MPIPFVAPPIGPVKPRPAISAYVLSLQKPGLPDFPLDRRNSLVVQRGVEGLDDPIWQLIERASAGIDGADVEQILAEPRDVVIPLYASTPSLGDLRILKARSRDDTNPRGGPFTIRAGLDDGSGRLIDGYKSAGMDQAMTDDSYWSDSQKFTITLHAGQPFWRSEHDFLVTWAQPAGRRPLLPILPLGPGKGGLIGSANPVTILGDVSTWPVWQITGPFESIIFEDVGAGRSFTWTASIGSGAVWTIDTRPGRKGVFDDSGVRQRSTLNKGADLFPLQPGLSKIMTTATGNGTGSLITANAQQLYLGA